MKQITTQPISSPRRWALILGWLLLCSLNAISAGRELIRDPHFQQGFTLLDPQPGKRVPYGVLEGTGGAAKPVWDLDQWSSKHPLAVAKPEVLPGGLIRYSNPAKTVTVGKPGSEQGDISLAVAASTEYPGRGRTNGEPWIHLLLEQNIENPPSLADLAAARLHVEARLKTSKRIETPDYTPALHAAQFQIFFSVQNLNRQSRGYGKYLWFGVPLYDDRSPFPSAHKTQDTGGTGMFIFTPDGRTYASVSTHGRDWVSIDKDLLPLMREGLTLAWARGFLKESQAYRDYHIAGINVGWELPGTFDVEMQIRGLSLRAESPAEQAHLLESKELESQIGRFKASPLQWRERLRTESLDPQALIQSGDADPLDVVLRRTEALMDYFRSRGWTNGIQEDWERLVPIARSTRPKADREVLFGKACALRRRLVLTNPLLDFEDIVCMLEQPGDARIIEQARAVWPGHARGGGPVLLRHFKSGPAVERVLAGVRVASGAWQGRELTGKFSGLELSCDGQRLYFAATTSNDAWHVFCLNLETRRLAQLTDGPFDDFDPYPLPSGRIVFTSTRRGGIGRCVLTPQSLTYTLHSMEPDGSDIVCLSFHETNEWAPSVNHEGKIVYTRWDYVDRHWGTAHHFWQCLPDGRDPRNYHGNYPLPWSAMTPDLQPSQYGKPALVSGRFLRPDVEISFRAVPGSPKFTATAVGHHEGFSGSLVLVDPTKPDDGKMSQVKRITPEYSFPEVEPGAIHAYGTAWPLNEDFYLCNFHSGLYVLDRFGNRELIFDPGTGPNRLRDPFPLRARPSPPVLPVLTWQGIRSSLPDHRRAVISIMNVYDADEVGQLPRGTTVKWMRIVQVIPQMLIDSCCNQETISLTAFTTDSIGRLPLGVVPVEDDGSVYCEAPVEKALYFQLLDEKGMAVQSMRSVTYVHPGEHLSCVGCHEDKWKAVQPRPKPAALKRPPSRLIPEVQGGAAPFNFYQLVKYPVFDKKCVPCHRQHPKAPDMSYASLARYDRAFSYPGEAGLQLLGVGGSRTTPGKFGAHASGIVKSLTAMPQHKDLRLSPEEWRRLTLWLDLNSNEIGWIGNDRDEILAQKRGLASWPPIDVDPNNYTGIELSRPPQPEP